MKHAVCKSLFGIFALVSLLAAGLTAGAQTSDPYPISSYGYKPGELLVKMKQGTPYARAESSEMEAAALARGLGAEMGRKLRSEEVLQGTYVLTVKPGEDVELKAMELMSDPDVEYAQPNYLYHTTVIPNDTYFSRLWGMNNTGQSVGGVAGKPGADMQMPEAWDISTGSSDVIVGVIDTGIDYTHPDLVPNLSVNPGEIPGNGVDDDNNGYVDDVYGINSITGSGDPMDDMGHGTHVSGTIGAKGNDGIGVAGVNWNARITALKFLDSSGSGYTSDAVECINYAVMMKKRGYNIRVLSNSWGGGPGAPNDSALDQAIRTAGNNDILFVVAAGNDSNNNDIHPVYPASSAAANVLAVAATDNRDALAHFSNYGTNSVDVAAPGVYIYSTVPGGGYAYMSGTSMATPHVSGLAALILSVYPDMSVAQLKQGIIDSVDVIQGLPVVSGGRVNAYNALSSSMTLEVTQDGGYTIMKATLKVNGQLQYGNKIKFYQDGVQVGYASTGDSTSTAPGVAIKKIKATPGSHTAYAISSATANFAALQTYAPPYTTYPPLITSLSPASAGAGVVVTVHGSYFGSLPGKINLTSGGFTGRVSPLTWTDTAITFKTPGKKAGSYDLTVKNNAMTSNVMTFTIPLPAISGISPSSAAAGDTASINGSYFGANKGSLLLKGANVSTTITPLTWSDDGTNAAITFITPPKPLGSYSITVKNAAGPSVPSGFTITP